MNFDRWIRQTSTIHGLGVAAAGIGAGLAHLTTGNPKVDFVVAATAYVLLHLGIDDHSAAEQSVTALTADLIQGMPAAKMLTDAAPLLAGVPTTASTNPVGA
jgi:hypothetical protein